MADIVWILIGTSFAVLVAFFIPVLLQLRKTAKESELFFRQINAKVDPLLDEVTETASNCNTISGEMKHGVARASHLFNALGKVGDSVDTVHHLVRGNAFKMVINVASLLAGLRAATEAMKKGTGANKEGGSNGTL